MRVRRSCAYCGSSAPLTREHIWPRCVIDRTPSYNARYAGKPQKFIEGELTVRDVCASCNNGALSMLDAYICELYDSQFSRIVKPRELRTFLYDYHLLLRWLLKISYNSARANDSDVDLLERFVLFVLLGGESPDDVRVQLELVRPSRNPAYKRGMSEIKEIPPKSVRCCRVEVQGVPVSCSGIRLVAINSFYFWMVFGLSGADDDFITSILPGTRLSPHCGRINLMARRDALDVHAEWLRNANARQSMRAMRKDKKR